MAISRMGNIKENKGANPNKGLMDVISYIMNQEKTENRTLVGGYNLIIDHEDPVRLAYDQMMATKQDYGKERGRQAYHFKISFATEDKVSPELAMKITQEFCERYLKDYENCYTVHTNTDHIHSHIVFNSVSFTTGLKYSYKNGDWKKYIQPVVNDICLKHKLSFIDLETPSKEKCRSYGDWLKENPKKKYTRAQGTWYSYERIRKDLDATIKKSKDFEDFKQQLGILGYRVEDGRKHFALLAPGRQKYVRTYILTPDHQTYTRENIKRMIDGTYRQIDRQVVLRQMYSDWNVFLQHKKFRISQLVSRDNLEFARTQEAIKMITENGFKSKEDVLNYQAYLEQADKELNIIAKYVNSTLRHCAVYEKEIEAIKMELKDRIFPGDEHDDKALDMTKDMIRRGVPPTRILYLKQCAETLDVNISAYKKKLFVDKKIVGRILSGNYVPETPEVQNHKNHKDNVQRNPYVL